MQDAVRENVVSLPAALPVFGERQREMTGIYKARSKRLLALFRFFDTVGLLLPKQQKPIPRDRPLKILITDWGHLGDVVTLLPIIKFLEKHPAVDEIGVLVGSWSRSILEATDIHARIYTVDHWALIRKPGSRLKKIVRYLANALSVIREIRARKYDVSIDTFPAFPVTHGITYLAGIPCRIGFNSAGMGTWLTHPYSWLAADIRITDQQLRLLEPVFGKDRPAVLGAAYPGFTPVGLPADCTFQKGKYVVVHMGAGEAIRGWAADKWSALIQDLHKESFEIVATGAGAWESELVGSIAAKVKIHNMTNRLSWAQFVTVITGAAAVVTTDTVTGHVSACFNIPTVVLTAGRKRISTWVPNSPSSIYITHPVGCYPCNRTRGCKQMACLQLIEVSQVLSVLNQILAVAA